MTENEELEELTEKELENALAALFKRTQTDEEFRMLCVENPEEAIIEISGKKLPKGKQLKFVDDEEKEGG